MSIPALIISTNALKISEQQRKISEQQWTDTLAQRDKDKREKEQAKTEAEAKARTAFFENIEHSTDHSGVAPIFIIRNPNARQAVLYAKVTRVDRDGNALGILAIHQVEIPPCSEATVTVPLPREGGINLQTALADSRSWSAWDPRSRSAWDPLSRSLIDRFEWAGSKDGTMRSYGLAPTKVRDIQPCIPPSA